MRFAFIAFRNSVLSDSKKKESSELKRYFDIEVLPSDTQPIVESKIRKIALRMGPLQEPGRFSGRYCGSCRDVDGRPRDAARTGRI